jgi:hypothetical protein
MLYYGMPRPDLQDTQRDRSLRAAEEYEFQRALRDLEERNRAERRATRRRRTRRLARPALKWLA